jgi:RHS repeat-associated protein
VKKSVTGTDGLKAIASYAYDIRGLRVESVKDSGTTYYQYGLTGELLWSDDGSTQEKYVYVNAVIWAEVRTTGGENATYYHHVDHLGTTETITDAAGTVVWDASYEAYGKLVHENGTVSFKASFTGKQVDADTGLYYFNARWYDAELGRFVTEDPARDGSNWYEYCRDNPLKYTDPDGKEQNLAQKVFTKVLSSISAKNEKVATFIKNHTTVNIQRSPLDNGENGTYFKSTESVKFMGIPLNRIDVQSTADYTSEVNAGNGRTIPAGEYTGTLLNKSGSYNNAISITGNGVSESEAVLCHPNCKTAKGNTSEYANGTRPFSAACQISHLEDFNEVTDIIKDVGFEYGKGNSAWSKGDSIKINIITPENLEEK